MLGLALRHDPSAATGIGRFDLVARSASDHAAPRTYAGRVTALGLPEPGTAADETVLFLHDPDGIEIRLVSPRHT